VKQELRRHLIPLSLIFTIISIIWIFNRVSYYQFIYLLFGFGWGAFFLDLDHLIFWLYLQPTLPQSRQAQQYLRQKDAKSLLQLLVKTHHTHTNLVFHHYFFQTTLILLSIFIISSSTGVFTAAFVTALNLHLIVDQLYDYKSHPRHLQKWLFAREKKQLPIKYLTHYLLFFSLINLLFIIMLTKSTL